PVLSIWGCISNWYGSCTAQDQANLQRVARSAERTIRTSLPTMHDIYHKRVELRTRNIMRDDSHPNANLFTLLPSGRRLRSLNSRTERHRRSFYPQAVRHLISNFLIQHSFLFFIYLFYFILFYFILFLHSVERRPFY